MSVFLRQMGCVCCLLAGLTPAASQAAVTGVAASPSSRQLLLDRVTPVTLAWAATTDAALGGTVYSPKGIFLTPTAVRLGTVERPMSKVISGTTTAMLNETALVPTRVIDDARKLGFDRLIYQRRFDDGRGSASGEIVLNIAPTGVAGFSVSRLALHFDDGAPARTVPTRDRLRVHASMRFLGAGYIQAIWEIAGPSLFGEPTYRPLQAARYYLTGDEPIVLSSPSLPTDVAGHYRIRLRISDPQPAFDVPVIRYIVVGRKD
jgi:hypothetical protein